MQLLAGTEAGTGAGVAQDRGGWGGGGRGGTHTLVPSPPPKKLRALVIRHATPG